MEKLTLKYVGENFVHSHEMVRYFRPKWSTQKCHDLLCNETCYPFDIEKIIFQLNQHFLTEEKEDLIKKINNFINQNIDSPANEILNEILIVLKEK